MYTATVEITFKATHSLLLPDNQKEPLHEHDWKVTATVESRQLDAYGMVIDFHKLQKLLKKTVEPLGRAASVNELPDFQNGNPSTECIAKYIYDRMAGKLVGNLTLRKVVLWETPDCRACYR
ncbi:MAG: 6-carboxy-5,6,7,8-tetrahydropterin synthase [Planctomycetes bacterium ADurb.Bin412]|nr:MAG: 6-carboxy-5,6,7,8-tetrahydropterin synthase [Planctomycetes bacterium ADurb.Bin412]